LTRILGAADFRIVASATTVDELVLAAPPRHRSVLLIIDAGDDLSDAVRQVGVFKKRNPTGRIAVLADHDDPSDLVSAFRGGANACFIKVAPCDAFIKSLELVMLGETILPAAMLSMIPDGTEVNDHDHEAAVRDIRKAAGEYLEAEGGGTPRLSARERCILHCLIEGDSNKLIARKIEIAEATVKVHVKAILRKIRVHNRTQAAIWAMSNGLSISAMGGGSSAPAKATVHPPLTSNVRPLPLSRRNGSPL
jgi:two-component system nitrate/nitrite response regulator NarL